MKLVIIDGNSLINRAYYAMQKPMMTKAGLYTQGVYGFLNMLNKIKTDHQPDYLCVAFDRKAPTFRHLEYAEYKAGRKKMPPELAMQMPLLKEVLQAMKIATLEIDGFEADDIIGTVTKKAEEGGLDSLIITGDKDELQLASKQTKVLITRKGISEFDLYDDEAMQEKYGFSAQQFIDFKGLMGDPSDNIPGIPGVGEKTAQKLIQEFGDIATLLASTEQISAKGLRQKVEENGQLALMSRRLATINREVPLEICLEDYKVQAPDVDALIEVYQKLEFNRFLKNMQIGESGQQKETAENQAENKKTALVADVDVPLTIFPADTDLSALREEIAEGTPLAIKVFSDRNHRAIPCIYGIVLMSEAHCWYLPVEQKGQIKALAALFREKKVLLMGHQLKDDYYVLLANGFEADRQDSAPTFSTAFDTALALYLLDPQRSNYDLSAVFLEYFHQELESETAFLARQGQMDLLQDAADDYAQYGKKWCMGLRKLAEVFAEKLREENLAEVFQQVELPLIEVLASMEQQGFAIDERELTQAGAAFGGKIDELSARIYALAGETFNINSPMQLGPILFEKLGLPHGKKTKRGYSTGVEILEKLKDEYEIAALILEYRMYAKLKSTYIEGLLPLIHQDGKIHAHFQQTVTATGRISCTEPNLQNIPIRQELGRTLRKAFVPESEDYVLIGADYSQIELRILAHMSQDPSLIQAFSEGDDIHRITAAKVFGVPEDEVTPLQRSNAKAVNFGVIYGMSGFGLSTGLNITRKEAELYISEYFKKYQKVKEFLDGLVQTAKDEGYVTTIMQRKRTINEIHASNYMVRQLGERLAMNSPIQGSAADIIKAAMISVYQELRKQGSKSRLILQVHDELIIETHRDEIETTKKLLENCMEQAVKLSVPLFVDMNMGNNWYELK